MIKGISGSKLKPSIQIRWLFCPITQKHNVIFRLDKKRKKVSPLSHLIQTKDKGSSRASSQASFVNDNYITDHLRVRVRESKIKSESGSTSYDFLSKSNSYWGIAISISSGIWQSPAQTSRECIPEASSPGQELPERPSPRMASSLPSPPDWYFLKKTARYPGSSIWMIFDNSMAAKQVRL